MINSSELKQRLYQHCMSYVDELIDRAQRGLHDAQKSANHEQKSSAGDKFETHRAMMHLQAESFIRRLNEAQALAEELQQLKLQTFNAVRLGALFETDTGFFFAAISAPVCEIEGIKYTCLSKQAPFYKAIQGSKVGDGIEWKNKQGEDDWIEVLSIH